MHYLRVIQKIKAARILAALIAVKTAKNGRSGGTRTHGLQYPKLARYHLRYASKRKKVLNFVVVSYVVNPEF